MIAHPLPTSSPDGTGQQFLDANGQPIGDTQVDPTEFADATPSKGLIQENRARWPEGPGAGPELVDTLIFLPFGAEVHELDKIQRTDVDPQQAYQVVYVDHDVGGAGHHVEIKARRIPL